MFQQIPLDDEFGSALDSLRELEESVDDAVVRRRSSERIKVATKVRVLPGNVSQRDDFVLEGLTGDISSGGCQILLPRPIMAGDLFWLDFSVGQAEDLGAMFARCMRCRLISEGTYEVGLRFFENVDLDFSFGM